MSTNISRRNFLKGMAAGAVGLAATGILGSRETVAVAAGTEAAAPAAVPADGKDEYLFIFNNNYLYFQYKICLNSSSFK